MNRFFFRRRAGAPDHSDASRRLTAEVRRLLALGEADGVSLSEVACSHPECGDAETVVLVMRAGRKTEAVKLLKATALVTDADLAEALQPLMPPAP